MSSVNRFTVNEDGSIFIILNDETTRPAQEDEVDWLEFPFNEEKATEFTWSDFYEE